MTANNDAQKVEESLRDFINRIIVHFEKYSLSGEVLDKYEDKIAHSDTLLEVFEVIKEMFEELMESVDNKFHRDDMHSESSASRCNFLGRTFNKYEADIGRHTREESNFEGLIREYKDKVSSLETELSETKSRVLKLEGELRIIASKNKALELTNIQFKSIVDNHDVSKRSRSRSKRTSRKSSSLDRQRTDLQIDGDQSDVRSIQSKCKTAKLFQAFSKQKDLLVTHPPPDYESVSSSAQKRKLDSSKKKKVILSGTEAEIPQRSTDRRAYQPNKRSISPQNKGINTSALIDPEKVEANYFRNCSNIYFAYTGQKLGRPSADERQSKEKLKGVIKTSAQTAKKVASKQLLLGNPVATSQTKPRNRSKSKEDPSIVEGNLSNFIGNRVVLPKRSRKIE